MAYPLEMISKAGIMQAQGLSPCFDDLLQKAVKNVDIADLFCQYSHHMNFTVFFVVQNLFADKMRCISLNTHFFLLMKQLRDILQIQTLAQ